MACVLNRSTFEIRYSTNTPEYGVEDWVINPDLSPVSGVETKYWKLTGDVLSEMNQSEKDAVDAACLPACRETKLAAITARTYELISGGFTFATKQFSLSQAAQTQMIGLNMVREDENVTWPVVWSTLDDDDCYNIPDAATFYSFYMTAMGTYRYYFDTGATLKASVRAATTIAEVDAVVDER